jgi:hypothetical protein
VHPGVAVADVVAATAFSLEIPAHVPDTRAPSAEELHLIRDVLDPAAARDREVPS